MHNKQYYVYILSNRSETLYVGVTNDLIRRVYEHKNKLVDGFTKRYSINILLYYEIHNDINEAILKEKKIKHWNHEWKIQLIKTMNPKLEDLYYSVLDLPSKREMTIPSKREMTIPSGNSSRFMGGKK